MPVTWMEHQGKQILLADYSGLSGEELAETFKAAVEAVNARPGKTLVLSDFTGAVVDTKFMGLAKELGKPKGERKATRMAAVGLSGLKPILLTGYNLATGAEMKPFDTREAALAWLVGEP